MTALDSKLLIESHREIDVPIALKVIREDGLEHGVELIKILRLLPGKRVVAVASYENTEILVKIFLGGSAGRYVSKEINGVELINKAKIRTPRLLWQAKLLDGLGQILAFEYLSEAKSFQTSWDESENDDSRISILSRAVLLIAKLHNHGVVQTDIHLDNFLISNNRMYAIDGGSVIDKSELPLGKAASVENLSWFFAQFLSSFDELIPIVLPAYEAARSWPSNPKIIIKLRDKLFRSRESRKNYFLKKVFRECSRFVCERSFDRFMVCERTEYNAEMQAFLADPDKLIASGKILKQGNSATVALVSLANKTLVVKRYNIKNAWHGLLRSLQKSRAWHSWENAHRLEFLGISSLKPLAMLEYRKGALRNKAYFITEYIEGPDALEYLPAKKDCQLESDALVSILGQLSKGRISHGDLKATNFIMSEAGPVIIDLDSMREHKNVSSFKGAFKKDLERFMKNWENSPELSRRFEDLLAGLV